MWISRDLFGCGSYGAQRHPRMEARRSGRVDKASATETVNYGSIPFRVKPKTIKIDIHSFQVYVQRLKGQCEALTVCGGQDGGQLPVLKRKVPSLSTGQVTW